MLRICIINGRSVPCFFSQSAMGRFLRDEKHFIIRMAFKKKISIFSWNGKNRAVELCPHYVAYLTHRNILINWEKSNEYCAVDLSTLERGNHSILPAQLVCLHTKRHISNPNISLRVGQMYFGSTRSYVVLHDYLPIYLYNCIRHHTFNWYVNSKSVNVNCRWNTDGKSVRAAERLVAVPT